MSTEITKAFVEQYSSNIQMLSQAKGSLLRDKVRLESVTGKNAFFDQIDTQTLHKLILLIQEEEFLLLIMSLQILLMI